MSHKLFQRATQALENGRHFAFVSVLSVGGSTPRSSGSRMLVYEDGQIDGTIGGGQVEHLAICEALRALKDQKPRRLSVHLTRDLGMCCGGEMEIFIDPVEPELDVVVFGAGHVAFALAPILTVLGCKLTVVDDRPELTNKERFPNAVLVDQDGLHYSANYPSNSNTYFLVVTHDHQRDQDIVERLLPKSMAWLGLIGSRSKIAKFFVRYRAAGIDERLFKKLNAPVGLDIGAETPAEIAVAIAAEMVRIRRGQKDRPQSLAEIPILARGGDGIAHPPGFSTPKVSIAPEDKEDRSPPLSTGPS